MALKRKEKEAFVESLRTIILEAEQRGLDLIIVDYLQLVTGGDNKSDNRVQEVSMITQGLKSLAKELSVPVMALSQLSRGIGCGSHPASRIPREAGSARPGSPSRDAADADHC